MSGEPTSIPFGTSASSGMKLDFDADPIFRLIAEYALDSIAVFDPKGRYLYANPAHYRLFQHHDAPVASRIDIFLHPDDRERAKRVFSDMVRDGIGRRSEFRLLRGADEFLHIECQGSVVLDPQGRVTHVIILSRNITRHRRNEDVLRARAQRMKEVQSFVNLGTWDWDIRTDMITWSDEMRKIFGVDADFQPTMQNIVAMVQPAERELVGRIAARGILTEDLHRIPYRVVCPNGEIRVIELSGSVVRDELGVPVQMVGVCQDITDKTSAEELARSSEERLGTMVENAREYAIYLLNNEGYVTSWNLGAERITGYRVEEVIGKHFSCFFPPEQVSTGTPARQLERALARGRHEGEGWRLRKNGSRFWARTIVTPLRDRSGQPRGFSKITHDVTERRRAEEGLRSYAERLRVTSRRLVEIQEAERRHLATELHDRVGQYLTALGLNLSIIANDLPLFRKPDIAARLEESSLLVRRTVDAMRNIMGELRPQALDDYGLLAALRLLAAAFFKRTGIQVILNGADCSSVIPKTIDLALFRIAQEALNNIAKHSSASRVEIALAQNNDIVILTLRDDGIGFDPQKPGGSHGWGLLIMRERAEAVGASFTLETSRGNGVRVQIEYRI